MNGAIKNLKTVARASRPGFSRQGFSLMELMLVLAIIGILMTVAAVSVLGAGDRAKSRATRASLDTIKTQLNAYNLEFSSYPPTLRTLIDTKFLEDKKLKDAWDSDWYYDARGISADRRFILGSAGPDKIAGNEDDIDVWTMNK